MGNSSQSAILPQPHRWRDCFESATAPRAETVEAVDSHDKIALELFADALRRFEVLDLIQEDFLNPSFQVFRHFEVAVVGGAVGQEIANGVETGMKLKKS